MPKPECEFFNPDLIPWQSVGGSPTAGVGGPGVRERILSLNEETGDVTRLLKFDAGVETSETIAHDFWEEVWILEGELVDLGKKQTFTAGMYACRPPGMVHGPYRVPKGCMTLEFRYYERSRSRQGHGVAMLELYLHRNGKREPVRFEVRRIVNAGFTGRDQSAVQRHIEELRAHGVPCPDRTPVLYPKFASLITTAPEIDVLGSGTSGEAEFVLLVELDRILVGAGSDHTDRDLEKTSIEKAKLVCPNVLSGEVWDLVEVRDGWDDLLLRSYVTVGGKRTLYQEGRLGGMMAPDDLIALVRERTDGELAGTAIYSGTLAVLGSELICGERFEVELSDDRRARLLRCDYRVTPVTWVKGEGP